MTDLIKQLTGRARFCRDRGEEKTPGLLEEAAAQLADAQAAQAMVVERCADMIEDNVRHAKELGREIWAMPDLRDLAPIDGLALVQELRAERDEAKRLMEMRHREMLAADELMRKHQRRADKAEADRDRLAAANAALEARLANGMKWCDLMDGPVSKSQFVNGQATAAQQIRAALAEVQADARREGGE